MDGSHCQIVANTLAGDRPVDEHTFASVAVLTERLDRLKSQGGFFSGVEFSPHVEKLKQHSEPLSIA